MARRDQTLYRDTDDTMLGGVCSGLGRYFDVDTVLVRVVFVMLTLIGGGGIVGYAILWAVLDPAPADYWTFPSPEAYGSVGSVIEDRDVVDVTSTEDVASGRS